MRNRLAEHENPLNPQCSWAKCYAGRRTKAIQIAEAETDWLSRELVFKESKKSSTEYRQRVIDAIVDKGMAARAEVCQMCGKIRSFRGVFAFWGAHYVDVEGKKEFVCGHCKAKKGGRHLAKADSKRFCELCTQRFTPTKKNDFPGSWVCNPCLKKIDKPLSLIKAF